MLRREFGKPSGSASRRWGLFASLVTHRQKNARQHGQLAGRNGLSRGLIPNRKLVAKKVEAAENMATEEDLKKAEEDESQEDESEAAASSDSAESDSKDASASEEKSTALTKAGAKEETSDAKGDEEEDAGAVVAPMQLGYQRYVYAAYMAGAMIAAFLTAKIGHAAWYRLGQWKPELGEPKDEIVFPIAGVIGVLIALYYWRKPESRQYANEVAEELSKVTWPSRKEVTNSTTVVVLTTVFATVFFALMDRFWSFITDKIYTF